jgi:hypothetical protein
VVNTSTCLQRGCGYRRNVQAAGLSRRLRLARERFFCVGNRRVRPFEVGSLLTVLLTKRVDA